MDAVTRAYSFLAKRPDGFWSDQILDRLLALRKASEPARACAVSALGELLDSAEADVQGAAVRA